MILKILRLIYFPISILVVSIIVFPISLLRPFTEKNTELFLKLYFYFVHPWMGFEYKIFNRERLDSNKPAIVVGNHQHNFDILMASIVFKNGIVSLGKRQIAFLPLFGQIFWLGGNFLISRGNKESAMHTMKKLEEYLKRKKIGMVIFPEGHRNSQKELLPFKKGAFYTAVRCQIPIVPFVVSHYALHMDLKKWRAAKMYIQILDPISTKNLTEKDIPALMAQVRMRMEEGILEINKKAGY